MHTCLGNLFGMTLVKALSLLTRTELLVSIVVGVLMALQAALGLLFPGSYRDVEWITLTWFGNDLVTLALAVPLLLGSALAASRGSMRGRLVWIGVLGYGVYNYAFYVLGASLNPFFAIYAASFVASAAGLIIGLSGTDTVRVAQSFLPQTPVRLIGGYYVFVAVGLSMVWLGMWAAYVFAGRPTPVPEESFRLVAALDLTLMVPALALGGVLLWRRSPWGFVIAAAAGVQASMYLTVLTLNSAIAIVVRGVPAPGELPVWGTLMLMTSFATVVLLKSSRTHESI